MTLAALLAAGTAAAEDMPLALEVVVNGVPTEMIAEFVLRDGALMASRGELHALGLAIPRAFPADQILIPLSALPGVSFRLDAPAQMLFLQAAATSFEAKVISAAAAGPRVITRASTGLTLDYDANAQNTDGKTSASGAADLRFFSPVGVLSTTALAFAGSAPTVSGTSAVIRLDTTYAYSDFERDQRYRAGDLITGGLSWTRPVRLGGLQITHDFSMRPDLITFPAPVVSGQVSVPSTVNVLLNGAQLYSQGVTPGPFAVSQLPVVSGAGQIQLTVTNALGQQVTTTQPFYASATLLQTGLQTWSAEAGAVRLNWGVLSNDYGAFAGSATWRRGLSSWATVEAHAEATEGQAMGGAGGVFNVFNLGVLNVAGAVSNAGGRTGGLGSVGLERLGRVVSLGLSGSWTTGGFRDVAAMEGDPYPSRQLTASASVSLGRPGAFGVAYAQIDRSGALNGQVATTAGPGGTPANPAAVAGPGAPLLINQHTRLLTANYSVQVRRIVIYATGFKDFADHRGSGVMIGVTIPLGPRRSATASAGADPHTFGQVQVQQSADVVGDYGYELYASGAGVNHAFAQGQYKASWGLITAGVDRAGVFDTVRGDLQGAVTLVDHGVFATNTINDSFAVVDTAGLRNVEVMSENRYAGRTDAGGRLLVPDLRAFEVNHLSIDANGLPEDVGVGQTQQEIRPPDRSGVVVPFMVSAAHSALIVLVDETGRPIARGAAATLEVTGAMAPVGYDGEVYFEGLAPHNRLAVDLPAGGHCTVAFDYQPRGGLIPKLGPLICRSAGK
jgi:outer membrane usher protein